ncbi:MAG: hypothetical protein ACYS0E_17555 [Planctomycetota bacterium]
MWRIGGILMLLAGAISAQEIPCPVVKTVPIVDGASDDAVWARTTATAIETRDRLHPNYTEHWTGPEDLSARIRAVRTDTDLYLLFGSCCRSTTA